MSGMQSDAGDATELGLEDVLHRNESEDEEEDERDRELIEVLVDERLDAGSELPDESGDEEEPARPAKRGCDDEREEGHLRGARSNGGDLVGDGRERGCDEEPDTELAPVGLLDTEPVVLGIVHIDDRVPDALHQRIPDVIAEHAAEDGACRADEGELEGLRWEGDRKRNDEHIRRDGEEGGFREGNEKQRPEGVGFFGEAFHPAVHAAEPISDAFHRSPALNKTATKVRVER